MNTDTFTVSAKNSLGHAGSSAATLRSIQSSRGRMQAEGRSVPHAASLTRAPQSAMIEEVAERDAIRRDYEEHRAALRAARMPNPVLAASIDRILVERPDVEPAIVRALDGYPYFAGGTA